MLQIISLNKKRKIQAAAFTKVIAGVNLFLMRQYLLQTDTSHLI